MKIDKEIGEGPEYLYAYYFPSQAIGLSWPHKIGYSKHDPIKRIKTQQASLQEEPIIGTLVHCYQAHALESLVHVVLKDRKLHTFGREWFDIHPNAIENTVTEGLSSLELHDQLRFIRHQQGLTQAQLAQYTGLRQATISAIESGKDVNWRSIREVIRELKCDIVLKPYV